MDYFHFIEKVKRTARKNKVKFTLSPDRSVDGCNGYFLDDPAELVVATGQDIEKWLPILVHESSHMDQWIEQCSAWTDTYPFGEDGLEAMEVIFMWTNHQVELNDEQLEKYMLVSQAVELDCEKRTVAKIKEFELDIDVDEYIQKSNAYVYFYYFMSRTRKWYTVGKEPYNIPEIWKVMPTTFVDDYNTMPDEIAALYFKHCHDIN